MGDAECAQQVLEGTYNHPERIEQASKMILDECSIMYLPMWREEFFTFVTAEGY